MDLMCKIREVKDKVTNVVMNYTETEAKVREATNDEAWGPSSTLMQEIAQSTFTYEQFPEVMQMLWKRMLQDRKSWRRTYKSLRLLDYLVRNGSEKVVTSAREHLYDLRSLEGFTFVDEHGKDVGINVRQKVKDLIEFIHDDDKLRDERKKAKKTKDKYIGMSSDSMSHKYNDWSSSSNSSSRRHEPEEWDSTKEKGGTGRYYGFGRRKSVEEGYHDNESIGSTSNEGRGGKGFKTKNNKYQLTSSEEVSGSKNGRKEGGRKSTSPLPSKDLLGGELVDFPRRNTNSNSNDDDRDFNPRQLQDISKNKNDFGDFSSFTNAPTSPTNQAGGQELFADFSPLRPPPQPTLPLFAQPNSGISFDLSSPSPVASTHFGVSNNTHFVSAPSNAALLMNISSGTSLFGNGNGNGKDNNSASTVQDDDLWMIMNSSSENTNKMNSQLLEPMQLCGISSQNFNSSNAGEIRQMPTQTTANTWSNSGKVNINIDNLLSTSRYDKPNAPSMNSMAGVQTIVPKMQQLNLQGGSGNSRMGMAFPVAANQIPVVSPNYGMSPSPLGSIPMRPGLVTSPNQFTYSGKPSFSVIAIDESDVMSVSQSGNEKRDYDEVDTAFWIEGAAILILKLSLILEVQQIPVMRGCLMQSK
ncbi:hypothetical protein CHUAL_006027 [Chamberlinius hualienensis]